MKKYKGYMKFEKGKIVCFSQVRCKDCKDKKDCISTDVYINTFGNIKDCMEERAYKRIRGKMQQVRS